MTQVYWRKSATPVHALLAQEPTLSLEVQQILNSKDLPVGNWLILFCPF